VVAVTNKRLKIWLKRFKILRSVLL